MPYLSGTADRRSPLRPTTTGPGPRASRAFYHMFSGCCALGALFVESRAMGLLTFGLNVTLDGCIDHTQAIVDDELHDYWTQLMDQSGAMLFGRNTYELMEGAWPAVARDEKAPRAMREWAQKLEAKPKYVVSRTRS